MAVAGVLTLAGCSVGADEEPRPASGPPAEIASVVQRLERATADGDWAEVCADLFTAAARERAGGADCARRLGQAVGQVRRPSIEIRAIQMRSRDRASVEINTRADGTGAASERLELRSEDGEWRIEALGR